MNILFITCHFTMFDKIDCGAANRSTMFVKALSLLGHVDVISFCQESIESNIPNCDVIVNHPLKGEIQDKSFFQKLLSYMKTILFPWLPSSYYRTDLRFEEIVDNAFAKKKYDVVACRYINEAITCGLQKYADKLVIDVDDNLVSAYLRDYKAIHFKNLRSKYLYLYRAHAIGVMSRCFLSKVRVSFYSNILEPTSKNSIFLHNVTMIQKEIPDISDRTPMRLLLVGWLDFHPNEYGALHFVKNVFPIVRKTIPNVELHIVGKCKKKGLLDYFNSVDGVKALGYVENVSIEYEQSRVVLVPVYQGAGTSVKFIEGLMMNRPMVSTAQGVRGFETVCKPNVDYLEADDDQEFADNIISLLKSIDVSKKLAHNALKKGIDNFSSKRFEDIVVNSITKEFAES